MDQLPIKISIITVCLNSEATIGDTIRSVSMQNYPHIEQVFVDGASNDNTLKVIHREGLQNRNVLCEPDGGIYEALNKGIDAATGDVIGFLHSDDFYPHSEVLQTVAKKFADPNLSAVYADAIYVSRSDTDKVIRRWPAKEFSIKRLQRGWMPCHSTLFVRKCWYKKIGGFDTSLRIAADYLSILQLFMDPSFKTQYIPEVVLHMRMGGASNRSIGSILRKSLEDYRVLKKTRVGGLLTLAGKNIRKLEQFL